MPDDHTHRRAATALVVVAYAWWAVARPPFSASATVAVLAAGVVAVAVGARRRRPARAPEPGFTAAWAALAALAVAWELAAYLQSPREDHPTLSSLTNALLDSHPARAAAFVAWLWVARELARR